MLTAMGEKADLIAWLLDVCTARNRR